MVNTTQSKVLTIELPPLHKGRDGKGGQVEILESPARFKVVVCGRRWGKTTYGCYLCLEQALKGKRIWWVAPTYKIANIAWRMLTRLAKRIPGADIKEGERVIYFPGGGEVWMMSSDNPEGLRGEGLDGVVMEEAGSQKAEVWRESLRPALADKKGWALFIGTPRGKNWFYNLWQDAARLPGWQRWRRPTIDNPYIDPEEIAQIKLSELPHIFAQEYEGDFGGSQLSVYPGFDRNIHKWKWEIPQFEYFIGGLDFAGTSIGSHKSAGVFGGVTKDDFLIELFAFEEFGANVTERQLEWMAQCEMRAKLMQRQLGHRVADTIWRADKTQSGFIQVMRNSQFRIIPSVGGNDSVYNGINLVGRRLVVRGDGFARFYLGPGLEKISDAIDRYRYPDMKEGDEQPQSRNPLKYEDDLVDALRYQVEGADLLVIGDPASLYKNTLPSVRGSVNG